ncbi:hypothetical protein FMUND_15859, partial [Fusarium mundagurra]
MLRGSSPLLLSFWLQFCAFLLLHSGAMLFREERVASVVSLAQAVVAFPGFSASHVLALFASAVSLAQVVAFPGTSASLVLVASPASPALTVVAFPGSSASFVLVASPGSLALV